MMQNSDARKRNNPSIPPVVLVERLNFTLRNAQLHAGAGLMDAVAKDVSEAQSLVDQLRMVV